ncbi:hypothetical protein KM043_004508 [Ampulex compressa]|nr:hypothetical protein KM043_004508 [Ampulex compressa]
MKSVEQDETKQKSLKAEPTRKPWWTGDNGHICTMDYRTLIEVGAAGDQVGTSRVSRWGEPGRETSRFERLYGPSLVLQSVDSGFFLRANEPRGDGKKEQLRAARREMARLSAAAEWRLDGSDHLRPRPFGHFGFLYAFRQKPWPAAVEIASARKRTPESGKGNGAKTGYGAVWNQETARHPVLASHRGTTAKTIALPTVIIFAELSAIFKNHCGINPGRRSREAPWVKSFRRTRGEAQREEEARRRNPDNKGRPRGFSRAAHSVSSALPFVSVRKRFHPYFGSGMGVTRAARNPRRGGG